MSIVSMPKGGILSSGDVGNTLGPPSEAEGLCSREEPSARQGMLARAAGQLQAVAHCPAVHQGFPVSL